MSIRSMDIESHQVNHYAGFDSVEEGVTVMRPWSTWRIQRLRAAARWRSQLPWRAEQIAASNAIRATEILLQERSAWTYRGATGAGG